MDITIRLAKESDFPEYLDLMQKTYQDAFVNEDLGLTKEMFATKYFHTATALQFFTDMMQVNDQQKCWLAFMNDELIGSITVKDTEHDYEIGGYYVATPYQGKGIGKKLWELAQDYANGKDMTLSVYLHNTQAIEMYKRWGFIKDTSRKVSIGHWEGWPEGVVIKTMYMRKHFNT